MRVVSVIKRSAGPLRTHHMWRNCLALILAVAVLLPQAAVPARAAPTSADEPSGGVTRIRIGVVKDGITFLTAADLAGAGIDLATVDPRTFAMSSLGKPVAIYVTGEADGRFDAGDRVYFFGEKFRGPEMDQKYTDERVYWLDMGGAAGPRMADVDATPQGGLTPPADFATTVHAEQSNVWWSLTTLSLDTQDTWFWSRLTATTSNGITATLPYTIPYPANAPAALRLEVISPPDDAKPDHRTTAAVNGVPVLDSTWKGSPLRKVLSAPIPAGVLTHGTNSVVVGAWLVPNVVVDQVYANYWEVDYRRLFRAFEEQIDFRAEAGGAQEYSVTGWSDPAVMAWDITDPLNPVRLRVPPAVTAQQAAVGDLALSFRVNTSAGNRYWLQGEKAAQAPASVRLRLPTGLRNPPDGADSVIVTSAALRPEAERLAKWHRQQGRRALVVDVQDAFDEFNEGIYHPKGVQAMMKWAAANWKKPAPQYLTLFGDGHWNFKGYNLAVYPTGPNQIPPYLAFVDKYQGEVPVDARYGDIDGDNLPDIAVGRIAVNNLDEARVVVDKIVNYDQGGRVADWQKRAIFVADNTDASGDFQAVSDDAIARLTPPDLVPTRVYLPPIPVSDAQLAAKKAELLNALNAGAVMVQYTGHGAPERWTSELLFTTADVATLSNGNRLPVIMTFNCLDGYFTHPTRTSMAETLQRQPNGGAIATISPSGLGETWDQQIFRGFLLNVMFKDRVRELGRALLIAKQRYAKVSGVDYLTQTVTLFGDPALKMAGPDSLKAYLPIVNR